MNTCGPSRRFTARQSDSLLVPGAGSLHAMLRCLLPWLSGAFFWLASCPSVPAGEIRTPPKCVGRICLEQHVDRLTSMISTTSEAATGPIAFLIDDPGYVSAEAGGMEESNWVQATGCETPGVIKTIQRASQEDKGANYDMVLAGLETRYGKGRSMDVTGTIYASAHVWRWEKPATEFVLKQIRGSKYITILLRDLALERKDAVCGGREAPGAWSAPILSPAALAASRTGSTLQLSSPEFGDNMDPGITPREAVYILSMQDALQIIQDITQVQEKLLSGASPADKDSLRHELKGINERARRLSRDFRGAFFNLPSSN